MAAGEGGRFMAPPRGRSWSRRQLLGAAVAGAALGATRLAPSLAGPLTDGALVQVAPAAPPAAVPVAQSTHAASSLPASPWSHVSLLGPDAILRYLSGRDPRFAGASPNSLIGFSPADIVETVDTDVLDTIGSRFGLGALLTIIYPLIAQHLLDALVALYPQQGIVLALDAGHGGDPAVYYDPGSNGTEALHTRATATALEQLAEAPDYARITVRRIFNDAIPDDFGLPPPEDRKDRAALTIRNARASILAYEGAAWNRTHPAAPVAVHVISIHFDAGSHATLVLHQGNDVLAVFQDRSLAYARLYLKLIPAALNATGLMPYPITLWQGTGLSDDRLLYAEPPSQVPAINPYTGADRSKFPPRYAMLQGGLLERDYIEGVLRYRGLA